MRESPPPLWATSSVLSHCTVKLFLTFGWNFLGNSFCLCLLFYWLTLERRAWSIFLIFIHINEVPSQPSHLKVEQVQLPQPFLIREILQTLGQLSSTLIELLQELNVSPALWGPDLYIVLQMWIHQG